MRVAVLGARGQLGAAIVHDLSPHHDLTPFGHQDLDITDDAAVASAMARVRPEAIINCAAYNDVDAAEDHPIDALNVNAFALRAVARAATSLDATVVHYGTDFVFDGNKREPYTETDTPNPRSVYAASKLVGEWFAEDAPRAYVLRVESLFGRVPGGPPAKGSVATILNTIMAGGEVRVFEDRIVSPTYLADASRATRELLERRAPPGLYHCVNSGHCTWLELARELARQLGVDANLVPVRLADMKLRAERPLYCALSNEKLASAGIAMPSWQDSLARYVEQVRSEPVR